MKDPSHLFTLRVRPDKSGQTIIIHAFDANHVDSTGHNGIEVEVRHAGKTIFPRGQLYCGTSRYVAVDSIAARELVLSLVAMRPGDTDSDYFADYSADQLDWASEHGEIIGAVREYRYCDGNGNVRKGARK
jgi:hypothetical protein